MNNPAVTRAGVEAQAGEWRRAADVCRARLLSEPLFERELAEHYLAVIADLENYASYIETRARTLHPSHYLGRSSSARGGHKHLTPNPALVAGADNFRAQAREIALGAQAIFGTSLDGSVATAMSVALSLKIDAESVRNWRRQLGS